MIRKKTIKNFLEGLEPMIALSVCNKGPDVPNHYDTEALQLPSFLLLFQNLNEIRFNKLSLKFRKIQPQGRISHAHSLQKLNSNIIILSHTQKNRSTIAYY
jgi:hypothetical protein